MCRPLAIHDDLGVQVELGFGHLRTDAHGLAAVEQDLLDAHALVHFGAEFFSMLCQEVVELAAIHVVDVVAVNSMLGEFAEGDGELFSAEGVPGCAVFPNELHFLHGVQEADLLERNVGGRHEGFADMRAWMIGLLQDDVVYAGKRKIAAQGSAGRPAADDDHIAHFSKNLQQIVAGVPDNRETPFAAGGCEGHESEQGAMMRAMQWMDFHEFD